ncbi:MAG: hypothetical protein ACRERV_03865 [Methylococcales bacterium]
MNYVNIACVSIVLVRLLQLVVFLIFTAIVLIYFGTLILLPLDALTQISSLLAWLGLPGVLAVVLALPIVGILAYVVYKIPRLLTLLLETGFELAIIGQSRVCEFNDIVASISLAKCRGTKAS